MSHYMFQLMVINLIQQKSHLLRRKKLIMKIIQKRIFEGKNIYSHKKCIRIDVDLEGYGEISSNKIPNFNFNLVKIIPELKTHRCGIDEEGGFLKRLEEGTYLAHICEHTIIALQNRLNIDVSYGKSREIREDLYYIIVQYEYKNTAIEIINLAIDLMNSLIKQIPIDFDRRMSYIQKVLLNEEIGTSTKTICNAAKKYNLPVIELSNSGIYQIGYGKMGKLIETTIGEKTSCLSADISSDKLLTKQLLKIQNIPIAQGYKIFNIIDLLRKAAKIGYPVVLKPQFGNKGKNVMLNIKDEKQLLKSYNIIKKSNKDILVEKFYTGNDYRACVVNYKVVAVSQRLCPFIIGDGKKTVKQCIDLLNEDSLRGEDHEKPLTKIKIDSELIIILRNQNFKLDDIPKINEKVILRQNANLSTGAIAVDCTNKICEENIDYCIRAAKTIGLDICGIDICTNDISKPLDKDKGIIMEVNAAPGIRMHCYPYRGDKQDVGKAIVKMLYDGKPKNIPVISITGTNGKTTTTRLISNTLKSIGYNVGMTSTQGIYINDKCIHQGDDSGFDSAKTILLNKEVDVAVLETARGGIIKKGLAYDCADVAVITNITNDHLGVDGINSLNELSFVKSLVGEAVKEDGYVVINADDEYSKKIINRIKCEKIYFSKDSNNPLIKENIKNNKIAVFIENNKIVVINNNKKYEIVNTKELPISYNNLLIYNIENAMAACGALVGLKVDYCIIAKAFMKFKLNSIYNLGRFNIYDYSNRKIILDYGHNYEGCKVVLEAVSKMKGKNNIIGVVGLPGDRQDDMIIKVGELCAEKLDKIIIKEDADKRGRKEGEVAQLLNKSILNINKKIKPEVCLNEGKALKLAINKSEKGDIIVIFYENIKPLLDIINVSQIESEFDFKCRTIQEIRKNNFQ
eukprot:TRINITY_DN3591_c0_g2_i1.p1 TRINITY_DN3591_c0_g2~~TRINITY_DN3591_c0_g2_i1.p1  ORF type:complete len:911 (-),score=144.48 TRINITY_DN3591_c0_g2_i1:845-3577(-)